MKYKKFSNSSQDLSKSSNISINSLDEIPLPNEIEIQSDSCEDSENSMDTEVDIETVDVSKASNPITPTSTNLLNRFFKNMDIDDLLLFAILILLLQEDVPDELLIGLILIILIQR